MLLYSKTSKLLLKFFTVLFYPQNLHQGQNRTVMRGPLGTSPGKTQWRKKGRQRTRYFDCCQTWERPYLTLPALIPDQGEWERKEQRHLRQRDRSHHSSVRNHGMLPRRWAPAKKSGPELGNQSWLTCRQGYVNSAKNCTQFRAELGLHSALWTQNMIPTLCISLQPIFITSNTPGTGNLGLCVYSRSL